MFVAVYHYDNLMSGYTSDSTGQFFTLSLDSVVSAPSVNWLNNNNPYVDSRLLFCLTMEETGRRCCWSRLQRHVKEL